MYKYRMSYLESLNVLLFIKLDVSKVVFFFQFLNLFQLQLILIYLTLINTYKFLFRKFSIYQCKVSQSVFNVSVEIPGRHLV